MHRVLCEAQAVGPDSQVSDCCLHREALPVDGVTIGLLLTSSTSTTAGRDNLRRARIQYRCSPDTAWTGVCSLPYGLPGVGRLTLAPESRLPRIQHWSAWRGHSRRRPSFASLSALWLRTICPGDSKMKWIVLACATLVAGCPNFPPAEVEQSLSDSLKAPTG